MRGMAVVVLPVVEFGVNPRNRLDGSPVTVNATLPVNPAFRVRVMTGCFGRKLSGRTR